MKKIAESNVSEKMAKKVIQNILIIGLMVIITFVSKAENELKTGTEGVWKTYRYVDGLAGNNVHAILQDGEGVIWFGTDSGVSRFDGKRKLEELHPKGWTRRQNCFCYNAR